MKHQSGNALFLILIAVALFAALSYAISISSRGGTGIDKEQAAIAVAQFEQDISLMQSAVFRAGIVGGYDQVFFDSSSDNPNATCYTGATTYTCHGIGLFNSEIGVPFYDASYIMHTASAFMWELVSSPAKISNIDIGSSAPEEMLYIYIT